MFMISREIIGWALMLFGVLLIWWLLQLALNRAVLEAIALSIPATIVFRAGVGFLRLTTAARIAKNVARNN
jgi:hypothetical protein